MFSTKTDTIEVIIAGQKVVVSDPLTVDKLISIATENGIQKSMRQSKNPYLYFFNNIE